MSFVTKNIRQSERKKKIQEKISSVFSKSIFLGKICAQILGKSAKKTAAFAGSRWKFLKERQEKKRRISWIFGTIGIFLGIIVISEVSFRALNFFQNFEFKDLLWIAGSDLPTDEYGMTNILLLGVGGESHSGGTLTDSIMIASIDHKTKTIALLSIPRDFYIETKTISSRVNSIIADTMAGYSMSAQDEGYNQGVLVLEKTIEDIFQIHIHRYLQIDFSGFTEGIDALGGVTVFVEKTIDDYTYPGKNWEYDHFFLPRGTHTLDGETALKYVRSRHGTSDFDRSQRQQNLLEAIQEKAISEEILTSPQKLKELYQIVQKNIKMDLEWREIISLANIGYNFPRENIFTFGLNNDETTPGGFLVTPSRELYGGASVLVPFLNLTKDKYGQIRPFAENVFRNRILRNSNVQIKILNGSNISGLAGTTAQHLERFGIPVEDVENSETDRENTVIEFEDTPESREIVNIIKRHIEAEVIPTPSLPWDEEIDIPKPPSVITITVGKNHENFRIPKSSLLSS